MEGSKAIRAEQELSDEQIHQLLKEAEARLRTAAPATSQTKSKLPTIGDHNVIEPYVKTSKDAAHVDPSHLVSEKDRQLANQIRVVEDPIAVKARKAEIKKATAGPEWYNLPRTVLTPELKRDLQLLRMRDVLDPKRHYKKESKKPSVPEYCQVGTIIEGPTEFFSGRLQNKDRKRTLVEEVLAGENSDQRFTSKYQDIQTAKRSGKKGEYNKMVAARRKNKVSKR